MSATPSMRSIPIVAGALALAGLSYFAAQQSQYLQRFLSAPHTADIMAMASQDPSASASRPMTTVKPISCEPLPDVPGKAITTAVVSFPPNGYTPRHRHPGSVTAFVLKGRLRSQLLGSDAETYSAGQSWFEPPGAVHLFAENASMSEPAELLAIFIADENCGPLVIPDHEH